MTYGTRIKQAREDLRLTQEQLAEQLDVSRQAVSKWEADLSRPTREKLDKLSQILDIPPETWAEIDAENAPPPPEPDPRAAWHWKIATAILAALCVVLAVVLTVTLWPKTNVDVPRPAEDQVPPANNPLQVEVPTGTDSPVIFPDTLPLAVYRDFDFGDWPLGEYAPSEVPFLDNGEEVMEKELWCGWFPDGTRLSLAPVTASWNDEYTNLYLLCAPPVETTGGELEYHILYRIGEDYTGDDYGDPEAEAFTNVLGFDGFKITMSHANGFYRDSNYITQRPDGSPCMMTASGETGHEADVDDDGVLEIVSFNKYLPGWEITDTTEGVEGAFTYILDYADLDLPDGFTFDFDPERGGFVLVDGDNSVVSRYVLRDGEMVRLPPTDFSILDYTDVAGTKITFVTDPDQAGILTDEIDPDEILPYNPAIRITHRQQAYLALQDLYDMTGLKVDECYCAASKYGVLFSLLPDGFNQRSFFDFDFDARYGGADHIPSIVIAWKELDCDWSPLSIADSTRPESWVEGNEETMLWYYDRMKVFRTGEPSYANFDELWLESGDLYLYFMTDTEYGPVLTHLTGPYPDGIVNH